MNQNENAKAKSSVREDRPGEAKKRRKMRAMYGENRQITGEYDQSLSAVCHNGTFVGQAKSGVLSYKGIPYAAAPVGQLRWKSPMLASESTNVYEAYYYGHSPIQSEWPSEEGSYYPQGEDCLTLNVWTSQQPSPKPKAVMVFFHGGSYGWGATSDPIYDGHNLVTAHPDVVLVTAEYRVGIMGFIDFSEVPGGEDYSASGNLGLLDHVCALQWIRRNIAAFGGDPENVTIFGESAGGGTVSLLPLMPQAKGLFRRVIAESGSVALTFSRTECRSLTKRLLEATGAKTMRELIALPEQTLMKVNDSLNDFNNFPERDGVVLPENLYAAYESGVTAGVDMMFGTNADEVRYWIREMGYYTKSWLGFMTFKLGMPVMYENNIARISEADKGNLDRFHELFRFRKLWRIVEFYNDILFRTPAIAQAESHAKNGGKSYMYYWTYPSAHRHLGACHAVELAYVFGNTDVTIYTGRNVLPALSRQVQQMWVNFAKTGNPSTEHTSWHPYDPELRVTMFLGKKIGEQIDPMPERRQYTMPLLKYGFCGTYTNLSLNVPLHYKIIAFFGAILAAVPTALVLLFYAVRKLIWKLFKKS